MSIGEEDMKGSDVTKEAFKLLKVSGLNFRGNIDGHDLFEKPAEVVVCDGFTGNVVLKTTEAVAHAIFSWFRLELFRIQFASSAQSSPKVHSSRFGKRPIMRSTVVCRCSA
jgi:fatty acid/phospholipid biosynthesis enzyme